MTNLTTNMTPYLAFQKLFKDLEKQYDRKLGFEGTIRDMDEQVQKSRQELHNISLQYAQRKDVLDKLVELMQYGVTAENIMHWTKIFKENKLDISMLGNDLLQYCSINMLTIHYLLKWAH